MKNRDVEQSTKFATTVDSLQEAWVFVMEYVALVGPDPEIHISPLWAYDYDEDIVRSEMGSRRQFEVMVEGMVTMKKEGLSAVPDA